MARIPLRAAIRGSQKWLQLMVNKTPDQLAAHLRSALRLADNRHLQWLSPLVDDDYAEYRDQAFLDRLGIKLPSRSLESFWPTRGPVWDGLGRVDSGELILVEAKAHVPEMASPPSVASEASLIKIRAGLEALRAHIGATAPADWTGKLYQYTNRLAHLYLLRELNGLPAHLVFIYFTGDTDMRGPETRQEWRGAIELAHALLGLPRRHRMSAYVHEVFIDVREAGE